MNKMSEEEYSRLSRHLLECGCPLLAETGYRVKVTGFRIEQVASECNMIFDLDNGQTGYVMDLRITNECDRPLRSNGIQIETPWGLADISLLPDPSKSKRGYEVYDFPDSGLSFDRRIVLNDFLSGARRLNPGDVI